jgi:hypothetical protein
MQRHRSPARLGVLELCDQTTPGEQPQVGLAPQGRITPDALAVLVQRRLAVAPLGVTLRCYAAATRLINGWAQVRIEELMPWQQSASRPNPEFAATSCLVAKLR